MSLKAHHTPVQLLQYSLHDMQCGSESVAVHSWNATGIDVLQSKVRASVGVCVWVCVCVCFVGLCTLYTQVSVYSFSWTNPFKIVWY